MQKYTKALIPLILLSACASRPIAPPLEEGITEIRQQATLQERATEEEKLRAVEEALERNDLDRLEQTIATIQVGILTDAQKLRRQLAIVRFYLKRDSPAIARRYINTVTDDFLSGIDRDLQLRWFLAYAEVLAAEGDARSALRLRLLLDERLTAEESANNHPTVLRLLSRLDMLALLKEAQLAPDLYMRGWYDFGVLIKLDPDSARLSPYDYWAESYRRHPGRRYFDELAEYHQRFPPLNQFRRVAFLLPFSGNLAEVSNAIYDGYKEQAGEMLEPIKLDTSEIPLGLLLNEAEEKETQLIVGPLRKDKVKEMHYLAEFVSVPVIALNELPQDPVLDNVYSLNINLKRSAEYAMDMAWNNLCQWALLLVDDTSLGLRLAETIQKGWEEKGGVLIKTSVLNGQRDVSPQVAGFLEVDVGEVAATKELYRRYLRILGKLGWTGEEIDNILAGTGKEEAIYYITSPTDERLLLQDEEIVWLQQEHYEKNFLTNQTFFADLYEAEQGNLSDVEFYGSRTPEELLDIFKKRMEDSYNRVEADCIFLAMERKMATQVRPYFSFYLSNDMDIYGTFLLFDAGLSREIYEDLHKVGYGEMPWLSDLLRDPAADDRLEAEDVYTLRYYALGGDAFLAAQSLARLDASRLFLLGHSGILGLQEKGELARRPRSVFFDRGVPVPQTRRSIFE